MDASHYQRRSASGETSIGIRSVACTAVFHKAACREYRADDCEYSQSNTGHQSKGASDKRIDQPRKSVRFCHSSVYGVQYPGHGEACGTRTERIEHPFFADLSKSGHALQAKPASLISNISGFSETCAGTNGLLARCPFMRRLTPRTQHKEPSHAYYNPHHRDPVCYDTCGL